MLEEATHSAQQARGAGGFIAAGLPLGQQRLQVVAADACQRQTAMVQPLHEHRQITTIGAERILRQIALQPKGIEKLFD